MSFSNQQARKDYYKARVANIRKQVTIFQVLSHFSIPIRTENHEVQYPCPLHGDGYDQGFSARAYPEEDGQGGSSYCFACQKSRDVVEWVKDKENLSFSQALSTLEERFNVQNKPSIYQFFDPSATSTDIHGEKETKLTQELRDILDGEPKEDVKKEIPFHQIERQIQRLVMEKRHLLKMSDIVALYYVLDKSQFQYTQHIIDYKKATSVLSKLATKINTMKARV